MQAKILAPILGALSTVILLGSLSTPAFATIIVVNGGSGGVPFSGSHLKGAIATANNRAKKKCEAKGGTFGGQVGECTVDWDTGGYSHVHCKFECTFPGEEAGSAAEGDPLLSFN